MQRERENKLKEKREKKFVCYDYLRIFITWKKLSKREQFNVA